MKRIITGICCAVLLIFGMSSCGLHLKWRFHQQHEAVPDHDERYKTSHLSGI